MVRITSHPCLLTPGELKPESPLFVFLPGMDGTGQLLRSQTQGLTQAFDVRCLAIPPDDLNHWDDLTDEVIHLIEAELTERPSRSVYLCGESFGGCLALKVALRASHLFDRIILSNPATSFSQQPWFLWGSPLISWLPGNFYSLSALGFLPFLASLDKLAPSDRRALLDAMRSVPAKTANWRLSMLKEFNVDEGQLERLTQPILVIASAADRLWSSLPEAKYLVECLPNAKMLVLPHSGHACLLEAAVNLFEILNDHDFLDSSVFARATATSSTEIIGV
ncbi:MULTISPECIES: alpha/beta fold hydrolase [unclassified Coleofasciculus]|uniref:alpha/beta fold hydrolase n=1 Tax=unclassified Coleofasciculus TaxID=2692782 RepID=UPI00187E047F|nr:MULTISPECIES: alpha/beta fold hydrolase [unclassified Coleofasciculus]MBE9124964.1 alpha/beta hydrolase [Coleofasciculus sp. LEGE 07081]MBE9147988.1 alpha/beta hydrolase [Coleofasciculus sp. LEGE 07092]